MTVAQSVKQPPNPPIPASLAARITAKLVDLTITAAIAFVALIFFEFMTLNIFEVKVHTDAEAYRLASPFLGVVLFEAATVAATAWRGITPGKSLLGIRVIAHSDSLPPGTTRGTIRWALPLIATVPLVVLFVRNIPEAANSNIGGSTTAWKRGDWLSGQVWLLWVALGWWLLVHVPAVWDRDRRGWHDKASDTIVVKSR